MGAPELFLLHACEVLPERGLIHAIKTDSWTETAFLYRPFSCEPTRGSNNHSTAGR